MKKNIMYDLFKKLHHIALKDKTIGIDINLPEVTSSIEFKYHNYNYDNNTKVIELVSLEDDTVFTIDTDKIQNITKYEELEGLRYNLQFDSWDANVWLLEY